MREPPEPLNQWKHLTRLPSRISAVPGLSTLILVLIILLSGGRSLADMVGPSFPCSPTPVDALSRLTCNGSVLARADIRMVQTYYALRQTVGPDGQKVLKSDFLSFVVATRRACGLPPVEPGRDQSLIPIPANAASCVAAAHDAKRAAWAGRLSGPAAEEVARSPEQNIALQARIQSLGFIPPDSPPDGVFGTGTRTGVLAWQHAQNRPETSFLNNADAVALLGAAADRIPSEPPDPLADIRAKPFARAEYHGQPLTISYKTLQVTLHEETSQDPLVCQAANGGILSLADGSSPPPAECHAVLATISVEGKEVLTATVVHLERDGNVEWLDIKAAIRRLDPSTPLPQVVITGYSGGAHCCTSTAVATTGTAELWQFVGLGQIDGDEGFNFLDPNHDGTSVLVDSGEGFFYQFASYSGSYAPTRIRSLTGMVLHDVTREPRYRSFLLRQLRDMERTSSQYGISEPNGYLAGWVAQKALVGQLDEAWRTMLATYDRGSTWGLQACTLDERVWVKLLGNSVPSCPDGEEISYPFPKSLALYLVELGYMTREESARLGIDTVEVAERRAAATARYEEQILRGWFVINRDGHCALSHEPQSPAAMIEADRRGGLEDTVNVLASDDDQAPIIVRVAEPRANGLFSMITFYRGRARCDSSQRQKQEEINRLK